MDTYFDLLKESQAATTEQAQQPQQPEMKPQTALRIDQIHEQSEQSLYTLDGLLKQLRAVIMTDPSLPQRHLKDVDRAREYITHINNLLFSDRSRFGTFIDFMSNFFSAFDDGPGDFMPPPEA